jgi:ATP-dependent RNA helicase DDX42
MDEYEELTGDAAAPAAAPAAAATAASGGTDFLAWSEPELRAFLDRRGEDADDCGDRAALARRAAECEAATGPAERPGAAGAEGGEEGDNSEEDPLDAFMAEIGEQAAAAEAAAPRAGGAGGGSARPPKRSRAGVDEDEESFEDFLAARGRRSDPVAAAAAAAGAAAAAAGYGSDEEAYAAAAAGAAAAAAERAGAPAPRGAAALPAVDHAATEYDSFERCLYAPPPELAALGAAAAAARRAALGVRVAAAGAPAPAPVDAFSQLSSALSAPLLAALASLNLAAPTPVQAQVLPAALSGRDVLATAPTGSGKTLAFLLPLLAHAAARGGAAPGAGPAALAAAPTRELAEQTHRLARRLARPAGLRAVAAAWGGLPIYDQIKELRAGAEVAICTPGRMVDLLRQKACPAARVSFLVLDEADRMFDMGFEPQVGGSGVVGWWLFVCTGLLGCSRGV